jgi:hypothetical protein
MLWRMTTPDSYEQQPEAQSLKAYLEGLHAQFLPDMTGGEILFRETRSEAAVRNNSGWARAEFSEGTLQKLTYVEAPETGKGRPRIKSVTYLPNNEPAHRFIKNVDHVHTGTLYTQSSYIEEEGQQAIADEIQLFLEEALMGDTFDISPHATELVEWGQRTKTRVRSEAGQESTVHKRTTKRRAFWAGRAGIQLFASRSVDEMQQRRWLR